MDSFDSSAVDGDDKIRTWIALNKNTTPMKRANDMAKGMSLSLKNLPMRETTRDHKTVEKRKNKPIVTARAMTRDPNATPSVCPDKISTARSINPIDRAAAREIWTGVNIGLSLFMMNAFNDSRMRLTIMPASCFCTTIHQRPRPFSRHRAYHQETPSPAGRSSRGPSPCRYNQRRERRYGPGREAIPRS